MQPTVGERVPEALRVARVRDAHGASLRLGELWADSPCLLVFLRHFGCGACSELVTALSPRLDELARLGVRTVFVGNGEVRHLAGFLERHALADKPVTVLTDPSLAAYAAAGLGRSWWATFGGAALVDKVRGLSGGHFQRGVEGDLLQQGGALLIEQSGRVALHRASAHLGDHPDPSELIDAVMRSRLASVAVHV